MARVHTMCIYWLFCITSYWIVTQSCTTSEHVAARLPGDIMIGGLFPMHKGVSNLLRKSDNESFICTSLHLRSMIEALSLIYAIEKINNSTLLQGVTLGYEIYDSCSHTLKAVHSALRLIPQSDVNNSTECSSSPTLYPVKAIVGETYSEISIAVSRLLGNYLIPQISPASSASTLSDKIRFPSFLRTVPSDTFQTKAIVELIKTFKWNWVGIVSSDDDYGQSALDLLNILLKSNGICTAFSKVVSSYVYNPSLQSSINSVIEDLRMSTTNVVIVVAKGPIVSILLKACIKANISKTWIASDSWSNSMEVLSTDDIENVGTVLGVNFRMGYIKGFEDYLRNLQPPGPGEVNRFLEEYQDLRFNCTDNYKKCINSSKDCPSDDSLTMKSPLACEKEYLPFTNDNFLAENIEWSKTYSTHLAIIAIAQALHNLLCKNGNCIKNTNFSPTQLLDELKTTNFSYNGETFQFDSFGDLLIGYDVLNWQSKEVRIVGDYNTLYERITINRSLVLWNTGQNQVPFSNCSKSCNPGYYRKYSFVSCCYECVDCAENYFSPNADMTECRKCSIDQWSNNGSSHCDNRTIKYFEWEDPFGITLVTFAALGALVVLLSICLFVKNANSPAVKAAGGHYTYLFMTSLLCSLASIMFFIGEPNNTVCKIRQPLYGISFTLSVSCILIKSMRVLLAFESASKGRMVVTLTYQPIIIASTITGIQILICILWLVLNGPYFTKIYHMPTQMILLCNEGSYVAFAIMLAYIGFLALVCFLLAYKGRKLPEKYNEARCITFSMLVYMFVWILFIPIYVNLNSDVYLSAVQAVAILASIYGMISCHILPVCYIVIFKRDSCDREKYLQSTFMFFRAKRNVFSVWQKPPNKQPSITKSKNDIEAVQVPQETYSFPVIRKRHKSC